MNVAQGTVQDAYDRLADVYDEVFCKRAFGEAMRTDVWRIADQAFGSARRLLDLGAGTGEDAIILLGRESTLPPSTALRG